MFELSFVLKIALGLLVLNTWLIVSKLDDVISELNHLRNASWKQHSIEKSQTKQEMNAVKRSVWGSADKKNDQPTQPQA